LLVLLLLLLLLLPAKLRGVAAVRGPGYGCLICR
jgi:hypothetical protein